MSHHNNGCGCNRLEATSIPAPSPTSFQITVIPLQAYRDYKYYVLDVGMSLPAHTGTEPVSINDGVNSYPLIDTNGQPVVSGRLRGHRRYRVRYGAGGTLSVGSMPPHFTVYDGLCCMEYSSNAALQAPAVPEI